MTYTVYLWDYKECKLADIWTWLAMHASMLWTCCRKESSSVELGIDVSMPRSIFITNFCCTKPLRTCEILQVIHWRVTGSQVGKCTSVQTLYTSACGLFQVQAAAISHVTKPALLQQTFQARRGGGGCYKGQSPPPPPPF